MVEGVVEIEIKVEVGSREEKVAEAKLSLPDIAVMFAVQ